VKSRRLTDQIRACQLVRETGEATPAGWEPGKKSLQPGEELVGKVCDIWSPEMAF
jgi:alkyl hydroperoxide reductase subunit AhpC